MIKVELLQRLLNVKDEELQKFDSEQLRVMLGVFRYLVRGLEREINRRCFAQPFGSIGIKEAGSGKRKGVKKAEKF